MTLCISRYKKVDSLIAIIQHTESHVVWSRFRTTCSSHMLDCLLLVFSLILSKTIIFCIKIKIFCASVTGPCINFLIGKCIPDLADVPWVCTSVYVYRIVYTYDWDSLFQTPPFATWALCGLSYIGLICSPWVFCRLLAKNIKSTFCWAQLP